MGESVAALSSLYLQTQVITRVLQILLLYKSYACLKYYPIGAPLTLVSLIVYGKPMNLWVILKALNPNDNSGVSV